MDYGDWGYLYIYIYIVVMVILITILVISTAESFIYVHMHECRSTHTAFARICEIEGDPVSETNCDILPQGTGG